MNKISEIMKSLKSQTNVGMIQIQTSKNRIVFSLKDSWTKAYTAGTYAINIDTGITEKISQGI